jgi:hypothetical protein
VDVAECGRECLEDLRAARDGQSAACADPDLPRGVTQSGDQNRHIGVGITEHCEGLEGRGTDQRIAVGAESPDGLHALGPDGRETARDPDPHLAVGIVDEAGDGRGQVE